MYGFGYSEEFIGDFMRETGARPQIATKYAPLPWRFTSGSVVDACKCGPNQSSQLVTQLDSPRPHLEVTMFCNCDDAECFLMHASATMVECYVSIRCRLEHHLILSIACAHSATLKGQSFVVYEPSLAWCWRHPSAAESALFSSRALVHRASLGRLGIDKMALYQIHWPGFITNGFFNDAFVRGLADCANAGLTSAVGVSNFKPERIRTASRILLARHPLAPVTAPSACASDLLPMLELWWTGKACLLMGERTLSDCWPIVRGAANPCVSKLCLYGQSGTATAHRPSPLTPRLGVWTHCKSTLRTRLCCAQDSGVPLASNQIQYSLLYRVPESNGVIEACKEAGATVIAYSPLAQGLLTGAL